MRVDVGGFFGTPKELANLCEFEHHCSLEWEVVGLIHIQVCDVVKWLKSDIQVRSSVSHKVLVAK